jgi:hypothetical protein
MYDVGAFEKFNGSLMVGPSECGSNGEGICVIITVKHEKLLGITPKNVPHN